MATRLENIVTRVRDTIADPLAERWTDAQLLRFIDEGQKTLVNSAELLRATIDITLATGIAQYSVPPAIPFFVIVTNAVGKTYKVPLPPGFITYSLPTNIFKLTRITDAFGKEVQITTRATLDHRYSPGWEVTTGAQLIAVVIDKLQASSIQVYPIPVPTTVPVVLTLFFTRKAQTLTMLTDLLEIGDEFDDALKFYATGMALRANQDTQNRQMGIEELQGFRAKLIQAQNRSGADFTGPAGQFDVEYQGGI